MKLDLHDYWQMLAIWREICTKPLSDAEKTDACFLVLKQYVDRLARRRVGQPNPSLRFYADMVVLKDLLRPSHSSFDFFGQMVVRPLHQVVKYWVRELENPLVPQRRDRYGHTFLVEKLGHIRPCELVQSRIWFQ